MPQRLDEIDERVVIGLPGAVDAVLRPFVVEVDAVQAVLLHRSGDLGGEGVCGLVGGEVREARTLVVAQNRQQHLGALGLHRPDLRLGVLQRLGDPLIEMQVRLLLVDVVIDVGREDHRHVERRALAVLQRIVGDVAEVVVVDLDVHHRLRVGVAMAVVAAAMMTAAASRGGWLGGEAGDHQRAGRGDGGGPGERAGEPSDAAWIGHE